MVAARKEKGVKTQLLPGLIWSNTRRTDQAEARILPISLDSRATSQELKLLDRTPEHQEHDNYRHLLSPSSIEQRKETSPLTEQCNILAARNSQVAAQISPEESYPIYREKRSPSIFCSGF